MIIDESKFSSVKLSPCCKFMSNFIIPQFRFPDPLAMILSS
ncbi:hypothetical protein LINPERPRIM_LOCUS19276 [Linum perenne]